MQSPGIKLLNFLFTIIFVSGISVSCNKVLDNSVAGTNFYQPGSSGFTAVDSSAIEYIDPYKEKLNTEMNQVLVYSVSSLEKGKPESKLGNMVADACLYIASEKYISSDGKGIDFCILNNGGLRSSLPEGAITKKNIFELMPFENELVVLTLNGTSLNKLLEYISSSGGVPVSGIRLKISNGNYEAVEIRNQPFDSLKTYKVVTSDYLAKGGDAMKMFEEKNNSEKINIKVRDAIMLYLTGITSKNEKLNMQLDGRISE